MTPNRFDGRDSTQWWKDLPPRVRERFTPAPLQAPADDALNHQVSFPPPATSWAGEASRIAVLFLFIALTNIAVLLLALSFLWSDFNPSPLPDPAASR